MSDRRTRTTGTTSGKVSKSIPVGGIGMFRKDVNARRVCPRCLSRMLPIGYIGARSRADNETEVCSPCGTSEAMNQFQWGRTESVEEWPIEVMGE